VGNLTMFQGRSIDPFYDGPLWSLSYEWWFYVLFFVVIKLEGAPGRQKFWAAGFSLIGIITALIFVNQPSLFLFYFMIWWCGVELARQFVDEGGITWRRQAFPLGALACLTLLSLLLVAQGVRHHQDLSVIDYPVLYFRHLFSALVLICVGIAWQKRQFFGFDLLFGWFAVLAPISYAIYVLHYPIIGAVDSFWPGQYVILKLAVIWSLILSLSWVLEIQMQSWINRWSNQFLTRKAVNDLPGPAPTAANAAAIRQHAAA
jgi:peptidoglycan/LPS O-acetylase OafA/YrhL